MLPSTIKEAMEEKYAWAAENVQAIDYECLDRKPSPDPDPTSTNELKLKHALWSFLQAYQQIRFYHGKWQKENGIRNLATKYMDRWRLDFLTPDQSKIWGLLNDIRTVDTHDAPILPTVHVQVKVLQVNGGLLLVNGKVLEIGRTKTVEVKVGKRYFELTNLIRTGLECMRYFIETIDQVQEPLQDDLPPTHIMLC